MNRIRIRLLLLTVLFFFISVEYALMAPFLPSLTDNFEVTPLLGGIIIWYITSSGTFSTYSAAFSVSSFFHYKISKKLEWKTLIIYGTFIQVSLFLLTTQGIAVFGLSVVNQLDNKYASALKTIKIHILRYGLFVKDSPRIRREHCRISK